MKTALTVAATFALAIATSFVVAQTAPTNTPPSANPPPTDTPPADASAVDPAMHPRASNMPALNHPGRMTPMPPDFSTLDRNGVGYVTQQDAATNPWLRENFATCDADHDGQISRSEYAACSKKN